MEPKAKTIIEKLGFLDADRKRPKHDEIQIWVYRNFRSILKEVFPEYQLNDPLSLVIEYPIMEYTNNRSQVVGFADIYDQRYKVAIEIKTAIPVLGDLIRQIQFYRKYGIVDWIIVCPDDRPASILKEQGIYFYKYQNSGELF